MRPHSHLLRAVLRTAALATAALGSFLFFAGTPSAQAADRDSCQRHIARTDWRLHEAIEDYGYYSRQANYWRQERREAYDRCYGGYGDRTRDRYERRYYRDRDGNYREYNGDRNRDRYYRDGNRDRD